MTEGAARSAELEMIPYAAHAVGAEDEHALVRTLYSGRLAQGPETARFEALLAGGIGASHAVVVSSGTAALQVALRALGVGPGDEVIVPSLTFVATANAVLLCGARPVFADVDPETLTLSPEEAAKCINSRTRGAVPMHFAGHPADTDALREAIGPERFLLEDACHALGAELRGQSVGTLGDAACFSFHPAKAITSGEGGAITTDSSELARRVRLLREHGLERDPECFEGLGLPAAHAEDEGGPWVYEMQELSSNYRIPELSAALGCSQYGRLDAWIERRRSIAAIYDSELADLDEIELPGERPEARSAWHLYVLRIRPERLRCSRRILFERLRARGLGVQVHYIPVHLQPYYRNRLGTRFGMLPVTEREYLRLITLPLYPSMTGTVLEQVIQVVRDEIGRARR